MHAHGQLPAKKAARIDGTDIVITVNGNIANIFIDGGTDLKHRFLFYEKSFNGGSWPYGYWVDYTEGAASSAQGKEHTYLIDEPSSIPMGWPIQVNSITRQSFRYKKEGSIKRPREVKVSVGTNDRYGNQYRAAGKNIYSWWHSGFGDLPVIEYEYFADFVADGYKFCPAYIVEQTLGYLYATEEAGYAIKVPVSLYKNGKDFLLCGKEGGALICDVVEREGDLLVLVSSYNAIWLIRYREDADVPQLTLGTVLTGEGLAGWPWRFSDDGTLFGGLMEDRTPAPGNLLTIHLFEYSLSRTEDGEYVWSQSRKTAYTQTYYDVKSTNPISESTNTPNPGGYLSWWKTHTRTGSRVDQTTTITAEYPIAANYIGNVLSVATLNIDKEYVYSSSTSSGNDIYQWAKYYSPGAPVIGYWVIGGKDNHSYTNNSDISLVRSYSYTLSFPRVEVALGDLVWSQTLEQHSDSWYYEENSINDVAYAGNPVYLAYCRTVVAKNSGNTYSINVEETVLGHSFQLRHIDVKRSTVAWIKINYDISRTGYGYQEDGRTDETTTIYVDYLQPTQSITSTREWTSYEESARPDASVTCNDLIEEDTAQHIITPFDGQEPIEVNDTTLLDLDESYPNTVYTWTRYKDINGGTLYETGDYTAATQTPNIDPKDPISPVGYYYAGASGTITLTQATPLPSEYMTHLFRASPSLVIEPGLEIKENAYFSTLFNCDTDAFNVAFNDAGYFYYLEFSYHPGVLEASPIYKSVHHYYLPQVDTLDLGTDSLSVYPIGFF